MFEADNYYQWGMSIAKGEITHPEIQGLLVALAKNPFVRLIDIQRNGPDEAVILDMQVEIPQNPPIPIKYKERVAIAISPDKSLPPTVLALRKDFPETLHQNLVNRDSPKSLCLFEEAFAEVRLTLTPENLLQRVADWLARAAVEGLHLEDQPLEPLLLTLDRIIFDPQLFDSKNENWNQVVVYPVSDHPMILRAIPAQDNPEIPQEKSHFVIPIDAPPWHSRIIEYRPTNFGDLGSLLLKLGVNLEQVSREFIEELWKKPGHESSLKKHVVFLLRLPKTRKPNENPEGPSEYWSFLVLTTIEELSIRLGIRGKQDKNMGTLLGTPTSSNLDTIGIVPLKPTFALTKQSAQASSGTSESDKEIVAIGAGSLGSEVVLDLARQGYGKWNIVDDDLVLPHNLSRHALTSWFQGTNKAVALSFEINQLLNSPDIATPYALNILKLTDEKSDLWQALARSNLIIDLSASHAVSRFLANSPFGSRKVCVFITPGGTHLIALAEEADRKSLTLEDLNYQVATAIVDNPQLSKLYSPAPGVTHYSGSCRDVSVILPQDTVGIFASLTSKLIKSLGSRSAPIIAVWEIDETDLSVRLYKPLVHEVNAFKRNGWTIRISDQANLEMKRYRAIQLPNETGGVILGAFDMPNHIVYVSKVLPSPVDSVEWPSSYIRGVRGLSEQVNNIRAVTSNELTYIGEWHSHPVGYSSHPSDLDLRAHEFLTKQMGIDGLPGLMLIKASHQVPHILLGTY